MKTDSTHKLKKKSNSVTISYKKHDIKDILGLMVIMNLFPEDCPLI